MYVIDAAEYAGVDRTTVYKWETADPDFKGSWTIVRDIRLRQLTDTAMDRALESDNDLLKFLINRFDRQAANRETTAIGEIAILEYEEPEDGSEPPSFFTFDENP